MRRLGMKQISIIVSITAFTILLGAVVIILNFTKGEVREDAFRDKTRIGLILHGSVRDDSWNSAHYEALEGISDELNLEIVYRENVPADENCLSVIRSLVNDEGCLAVITSSTDYEESTLKAADEFRDRYFINIGGTSTRRNMSTCFGRMYQIRYLSGIVAGLDSAGGSIGYVAPFPNSEVNRGINAFTLGVRSVAPDAVVHVAFCESWGDDNAAGAAAVKLIERYGADVISVHVDSLTPLETADVYGKHSVGNSRDNSAKYPDSCICSCVWDWKNYYSEQLRSCIQRKFRGEHSWEGMESGIVALSGPAGELAVKCGSRLHEAEEGFKKHTKDVFYGPVTDNTGAVRVASDESMSDESMLNSFDWYVEGVEIAE